MLPNNTGDLFGALAVLAMLLWPLFMIAGIVFGFWILLTVTLSIRGIRRELSRLNDLIERNGAIRVSGGVAAADGPRDDTAVSSYTRTSPLNLAGTR